MTQLGLEPMVRRDPLVITQSDIRAFTVCRRNWMIGSYLGLTPNEVPPFGPLPLGSRVHKALELYYADGQDPVDAYLAIAKQELAKLEESGILFDRTAWESETDLGRIMLEGYVIWLEDTGADANYEILGAEQRLTYDLDVLGTSVQLRGKVDLRVRNMVTGARLVLDHKTTASFSNLTITAQYDVQLLFYLLLERLQPQMDESDWLEGAVFSMLRKVKRSERSKPPYYERIEVHHNETTLRNYWTRLMGTLEDYVRVVHRLDDGQEHRFVAYPTPGPQCRFCPAKAPCLMVDDGSHAEEMIHDLYYQDDPHRRYEKEPAPLLDEVAANPGGF